MVSPVPARCCYSDMVRRRTALPRLGTNKPGHQVNHVGKGFGQFAVADGDAAKLLEVGKGVFHQMPGFVGVAVVFCGGQAIGSGQYGGYNVPGSQERADGVAIIGFVTQQFSSFGQGHTVEQSCKLGPLGGVARPCTLHLHMPAAKAAHGGLHPVGRLTGPVLC